jgi:hypothetical protein
MVAGQPVNDPSDMKEHQQDYATGTKGSDIVAEEIMKLITCRGDPEF